MRLRVRTMMAAALVACAGLVAGTVGARPDRRGPGEDGAEEARVATVRDAMGGTWTVRIDPPDARAGRDLALTATHVSARGERVERATRLAEGALWWPTIAPLEPGIAVDGERVIIDVTRVGFRAYPMAHIVVDP